MSKSSKARNADHVRRTNRPSPSNEVIEECLQSLSKPPVFRQLAYYRSLGPRSSILSLPVMVAAVLTLLWRQVPSVCELTKLLGREDLFWTPKSQSQPTCAESVFSDLSRQVIPAALARLTAAFA